MHHKDTIRYAKRLFVKDGWSLENIAAEVNTSYSTVRNWSQNGQWELEKDRDANAENFAENTYKFAAFIRDEIERQMRAGQKVDNGQIKMFSVIINKIESVLRLECELKKASKKENAEDNIPPQVRNLPEVRKALETIENAVFKYNNKGKSK